jgi:hypothetical protein
MKTTRPAPEAMTSPRCAPCAIRSTGRRRPVRHPGVQRIDPRRAQERPRLDLPPIAANVLRNKPVAVVGASTGLFGAAWAQDELRKILRTIGAKVVDRELALAQAHQQFDERGSLLSADLHEQLVAHYELLDAASAFRLTAQIIS